MLAASDVAEDAFEDLLCDPPARPDFLAPTDTLCRLEVYPPSIIATKYSTHFSSSDRKDRLSSSSSFLARPRKPLRPAFFLKVRLRLYSVSLPRLRHTRA